MRRPHALARRQSSVLDTLTPQIFPALGELPLAWPSLLGEIRLAMLPFPRFAANVPANVQGNGECLGALGCVFSYPL